MAACPRCRRRGSSVISPKLRIAPTTTVGDLWPTQLASFAADRTTGGVMSDADPQRHREPPTPGGDAGEGWLPRADPTSSSFSAALVRDAIRAGGGGRSESCSCRAATTPRGVLAGPHTRAGEWGVAALLGRAAAAAVTRNGRRQLTCTTVTARPTHDLPVGQVRCYRRPRTWEWGDRARLVGRRECGNGRLAVGRGIAALGLGGIPAGPLEC